MGEPVETRAADRKAGGPRYPFCGLLIEERIAEFLECKIPRRPANEKIPDRHRGNWQWVFVLFTRFARVRLRGTHA
jgi:hypothetical protein